MYSTESTAYPAVSRTQSRREVSCAEAYAVLYASHTDSSQGRAQSVSHGALASRLTGFINKRLKKLNRDPLVSITLDNSNLSYGITISKHNSECALCTESRT